MGRACVKLVFSAWLGTQASLTALHLRQWAGIITELGRICLDISDLTEFVFLCLTETIPATASSRNAEPLDKRPCGTTRW